MKRQKTTATPSTPRPEPTLAETLAMHVMSESWTVAHRAEDVVVHARRIARRLRELAEDLDQKTDRATQGEPELVARLAYDITHDVNWMVPNLNLDGLNSAALELAQSQGKLRALTATVVAPQVEQFARVLGASAILADTFPLTEAK